MRQQRAKHGDDWVPPEGTEVAVGVNDTRLAMGVALVAVLLRAAYEEGQRPEALRELVADARSVRQLEARVDAQQEQIQQLQSAVAELQRDAAGGGSGGGGLQGGL